MPLYKVAHSYQGKFGDSKDQYVNTFHFWHPTALITDLAPNASPWSDALASTLNDFYQADDGVGVSINDYMSRRITGGEIMKFYDGASAPPNPPLAVVDYGVPAVPPDVLPLPEECAVCLSYSATAVGVPAGRKRGRIYIGPLSTAAVDDVNDNDQPVEVAGAFRQTLLDHAVSLQGALNGAGWEWRIYSPTNNNSYVIDQWSVDNAFDTVRGRGTAPSARDFSS